MNGLNMLELFDKLRWKTYLGHSKQNVSPAIMIVKKAKEKIFERLTSAGNLTGVGVKNNSWLLRWRARGRLLERGLSELALSASVTW